MVAWRIQRNTPTLKLGGVEFKDLNTNSALNKYEDWRLPADVRVADLISRLTLEEKAGLMIHTSLMGFTGPGGEVLDAPRPGQAFPGGPGGRAGDAGDAVNRAIRGRANPHNITPLDRPNPAEYILKSNIRWILVRPNEVPAGHSTGDNFRSAPRAGS